MNSCLNLVNVIGHTHDGFDDIRHFGLIVLEHLDKVVLKSFRMFLPVDDAVVEERAAVGIDTGEVVNVSIGKSCSFRNVIEEDSRDGFIDMQAGDFTETGETGYGNIPELVDMFDFIRIPQTAQDTVVKYTTDGLRLVGCISLKVTAQRLGQGNTF